MVTCLPAKQWLTLTGEMSSTLMPSAIFLKNKQFTQTKRTDNSTGL